MHVCFFGTLVVDMVIVVDRVIVSSGVVFVGRIVFGKIVMDDKWCFFILSDAYHMNVLCINSVVSYHILIFVLVSIIFIGMTMVLGVFFV